MRYHIILLIFILSFSNVYSQNSIWMPSLFSNNMVLQQKSNTPFWGKSFPNSEIEIHTSWGETVRTIAGNDSNWFSEIKTPKAGGPFKIEISNGKQTLMFIDILIGEVWLCSGQSNMEMPLKGWLPKDIILNSEEIIRTANNDSIRLLSVVKTKSITENNNIKGTWEKATSKTASNFSATAYLFGEKLFRELKVPIGLIHSSWGGTPAQAWTNKEYLSYLKEFNIDLNNIKNAVPEQKKLITWLNNFPLVNVKDYNKNNLWNNIELNDSHLSLYNLDDKDWETMELPINWENTNLGEFNGFVWFRKKIKLPDDWIGKKLTIELGAIDDYDETYINGKKIASMESYNSWKTNRIYSISEKINTKKDLLIAVRVNDTGGGGGLYGGGFKMRLICDQSKEEVSLAGDWKYIPISELYDNKYYVFTNESNEFSKRPKIDFYLSQYTPTSLYNGMITPLIPYKIKGVIWYQGESNTNNPEQYERLFPTLISNWRNDWGYDFPFYFVQIAPYANYGDEKNTAYLRDAQRKTLAISNTGMVVTLDIGDFQNIHPANKKDVGERLALLALKNQYKQDVVCSGPLYNSMVINGNKIELTFKHVGGGLVLNEAVENNEFLIAGPDKNFIKSKVKIFGNKLLVWSDEIDVPLAVRYAWSNIPNATLFNKEGLPASSFRTDSWK